MLNNDGVVAFELDTVFFAVLVKVVNSNASMANNIARHIAVNREANLLLRQEQRLEQSERRFLDCT